MELDFPSIVHQYKNLLARIGRTQGSHSVQERLAEIGQRRGHFVPASPANPYPTPPYSEWTRPPAGRVRPPTGPPPVNPYSMPPERARQPTDIAPANQYSVPSHQNPGRPPAGEIEGLQVDHRHDNTPALTPPNVERTLEEARAALEEARAGLARAGNRESELLSQLEKEKAREADLKQALDQMTEQAEECEATKKFYDKLWNRDVDEWIRRNEYRRGQAAPAARGGKKYNKSSDGTGPRRAAPAAERGERRIWLEQAMMRQAETLSGFKDQQFTEWLDSFVRNAAESMEDKWDKAELIMRNLLSTGKKSDWLRANAIFLALQELEPGSGKVPGASYMQRQRAVHQRLERRERAQAAAQRPKRGDGEPSSDPPQDWPQFAAFTLQDFENWLAEFVGDGATRDQLIKLLQYLREYFKQGMTDDNRAMIMAVLHAIPTAPTQMSM